MELYLVLSAYGGAHTKGIQEVARSIRVSSTNKIEHFLSFGHHRGLSEKCPDFSSTTSVQQACPGNGEGEHGAIEQGPHR
jgi:hypothetical protein